MGLCSHFLNVSGIVFFPMEDEQGAGNDQDREGTALWTWLVMIIF
jgi:hypothetical protein